MTVGGAAPQNGSLRSHATACVEAGLCALPAVGREKRAALKAWKPYQSRLPTCDEIDSWFKGRRRAMCLVCGAVSGNLEMIDFDLAGEAFEPWRAAVGSAAPGLLDRLIIESSPSGGRHAVYRCEDSVSGNIKLAERRLPADGPDPVVVCGKQYRPRQDDSGQWFITVTLIETRGEGGLFLCAPSEGYQLLQGDFCQPPVLTTDERDVLLGCASMLNELPAEIVGRRMTSSGSAAGNRPGDDFNERGDARDVLRAHGWEREREGDNEHWRRPGKAAGTSATLKDGAFYVFSSNAAPFEPHKGYSPFATYALLEHRGDFSAAAASLSAKGYGQPSSNRQNTLAASAGAVPESHPVVAPAPRSVGELVASHRTLRPTVIHGLLRAGETMNIITATKVGKSWLATDMAMAVATGRHWLGIYPTVAGRVLILDNELHPETIAHRIGRVAESRSIDMAAISEQIFVENFRGRLLDIFKLGPYFEGLEPGRFKIIVLDAFYRFLPPGTDENANGVMATIYNQLDAYADRLNCCFVLIHHATKGSQSDKSVTDVGAGAGAQSRATDTHLVLRPHEEEGVVVLEAAVRSWPPVEPICLRWSFPVWTPDGSLEPTSLQRRAPKQRKEPKPKEPKPEPWSLEQFVETFFGAEPISLAALCEAATHGRGISHRQFKVLLSLAEEKDRVRRVKLPGRGGRAGFVLAIPEGQP